MFSLHTRTHAPLCRCVRAASSAFVSLLRHNLLPLIPSTGFQAPEVGYIPFSPPLAGSLEGTTNSIGLGTSLDLKTKELALVVMAEVNPEVVASKATSTTSISSFHRTTTIMKKICLDVWWLWKPGGRGIGVGGYAIGQGHACKTFQSAVITKRHDSSTLETSDGFTILISGLLNMVRTVRNGFPPEVCCHFISGFPYDWEDYFAQCDRDKSSNGYGNTGSSGLDEFDRIDGKSTLLLECTNGFSVGKICDLLMSANANCEEQILEDFIFSNLRKSDAAVGVSVAGQNFENCDGQVVVSSLSPSTPVGDVQRARSNNDDISSSHAINASQCDGKGESSLCSPFPEAQISSKHVCTRSKFRSKRICSTKSRNATWTRLERVCTRSMTRLNKLVG